MIGPFCEWGWGWGWWGAGLGWLVPLAFLGLVAWIVLRVSRSNPAAGGDRALGILAERFARGEIDRDVYESMRRDLS